VKRAPRRARLAWLALVLCAAATVAARELPPASDDYDDITLPDSPEDAAAATEAFARMDSNRDGELSLEEFEKGLARPFGSQREGVVYQKLPARFRMFDTDGSSYLEPGEYAALVQRWFGPAEAPTLAQADHDHDGRIDFREFALEFAPRDEDATAPAAAREAGSATSR